MNKYDFKFVATSFLVWRLGLVIVSLVVLNTFGVQKDFLGGGYANFIQSPPTWSLSNFDGVHFLDIAQTGYKPLQYFFFPLYPLLIRFISAIIGSGLKDFLLSGIFVSNLAIFVGLVGLFKLVNSLYDRSKAKYSVLGMLVFPTSFYFGTVYSESVFFALCVWFFVFLERKKWILAGALAGLATATRVVGIALPLVLFIELVRYRKEVKLTINNILITLGLSVSGIAAYVYYLFIKTGDPLEFIHSVGIYGEQRSSTLIFLPQVFYRYIAKVLPNINYDYLPVVFTTYLEFVIATLFLYLLVISYKKLNARYWIYSLIIYLVPTLSGSFSSLPRYVLPAFPLTIVVVTWLGKKNMAKYYIFMGIFQIVFYSLFTLGYWVS